MTGEHHTHPQDRCEPAHHHGGHAPSLSVPPVPTDGKNVEQVDLHLPDASANPTERTWQVLPMKIGGRDAPDTIRMERRTALVPHEDVGHPILGAIQKVISSRTGSLRRVMAQVS